MSRLDRLKEARREVERAALDRWRERTDVREKAKEIVKFIKDSKVKVQASIQGETVRVSGKDRDTLQRLIA